MGLIDLPPELLLQVVKLGIPESFEEVALTCKALYEVCRPFIETHNSLHARYSDFSFSKPPDTYDYEGSSGSWDEHEDPIFSSVELVLRIADNPLIARYIECVDLRHDINSFDSEAHVEAGERVKHRLDEGDPQLLALLEDSSYLKDADIAPEELMRDLVRDYSPDQKEVISLNSSLFLLTLLPNVRELALPTSWSNFPMPSLSSAQTEKQAKVQRYWKLLDAIVQKAQEGSSAAATHQPALGLLDTLLPTNETGYESRMGLQTFAPFLSLPSMETFLTAGCVANDDGYTGKPFDPRYESFGANLERIEMAGCCVDEVEIAKMLSRCPKLTVLKFSYETKWHGCGHDWDRSLFFAAVEEAVASTLEELSLSILVCYGDSGPPITSFKKFARLRDLELETAMLVSNSESEGSSKVPPLLDLLPPSIERITLLTNTLDRSVDCMQKLFQDFGDSERRSAALPALQSVKIKCGRGREAVMDQKKQKTKLERRDPRWKPIVDALQAFGKGKLIETNSHTPFASFM